MNQSSKIKLDGIYTDEFGLEVQGRYEVPTAEEDIEYIEIRGRDGELTKKYGYKNIPLPVSFSINRRWQEGTFKSIFRKIKPRILNSKTFSVDDDPEVYYKIKSAQIESAENKIVKFGQFVVNFLFNPYMYEINNDPIIVTSRTIIKNDGHETLPIITAQVSGTGKIYVNDQEITIKNVNGSITIDSMMQNAYRKSSGIITENMNNHMIGHFPALQHGDNVIEFDGDIERLEIVCNRRWV